MWWLIIIIIIDFSRPSLYYYCILSDRPCRIAFFMKHRENLRSCCFCLLFRTLFEAPLQNHEIFKQIVFLWSLKGFWSLLASLGASWAAPGPSGGALEALLAALRALLWPLGQLLGPLGPLLAAVGVVLALLGRSWGPFWLPGGIFFGAFWISF